MKKLLLPFLIVFLAACSDTANSPRGFNLPEGDIERGKEIFLSFDCLACHSMKGIDSDSSQLEIQTPVKLGGAVTRVKTYGELVTAVINPSHKIAKGYSENMVTSGDGESLMRNYNDYMTVSELVDLVAFLESHYELIPFQRTGYPSYYP